MILRALSGPPGVVECAVTDSAASVALTTNNVIARGCRFMFVHTYEYPAEAG